MLRSDGMATPILDAIRRCGSREVFSATTAKTTSPGERNFKPSLRGISFACGGKIDETRTRFCAAIPASRSASSNDVRRSLCFPTPLVKNRRFGTMALPNVCSSSWLNGALPPASKYHKNDPAPAGEREAFIHYSQNEEARFCNSLHCFGILEPGCR